MVKKNSEHFIHKENLITRLVNHDKSFDVKKLGKNDLVWLAHDHNLISDIQRDESLNKRYSSIPCYLYSHVKNDNVYSQRQKKWDSPFFPILIDVNICLSFNILNFFI